MATNPSRRFIRRLLPHLRAALDVYSVRFSIGLVASLLLIIGLTQLPLQEQRSRVGWDTQAASERIQISEFRLKPDDASGRADEASPPITTQRERSGAPSETPPPASENPAALTASGSGSSDTSSSARRDAVQLAALGPSDQVPQIVGGRGSLYLRIDYPEEARRQGIEGRVVLDFIVDTDGITHDIRVLRPLHPLCDSAAVDALQDTRFVPAKRNGEKVPVRMRLPVRFQIINYAATTTESDQDE